MIRAFQFQGEGNAHSAAADEARRADFPAFRELAREIGRLLSGFVPPEEGYRPEPPLPPDRLGPEIGRDLGAASLSDFFALALEGEVRPEAGRLPAHFPRGPETVRQASAALDVEIGRLIQAGISLEKNWPISRFGLEAALRPLEERRTALAAGRAGLERAARLWPRLKDESDLWLDEARAMWRKARRLAESQDLALKAGSNNEPAWSASPQADLTGAIRNLRAEVSSAQALALKGEGWTQQTGALTAELDDLLALALDGSEPERDWADIVRHLAGRLKDLHQTERDLTLAEPLAAQALETAAGSLAEAEEKLTGARGLETRGRLESLSRGLTALWGSVVDIRREMARLYFFLPERLGRPAYLEKNFLSAARILGRTQALLEDLRHRLSLAGGRLSSSQKLKAGSAELLEQLRRPANRPAVMDTARSRLKKLASAIARPPAPLVERNPLDQTLSSVQLEKERLAEQLAEARRALGETGLTKARLMRVFELKAKLLTAADQKLSHLTEETQLLRHQRGELARRHGLLTEALTQARGRVEDFRAALNEYQDNAIRPLLAEHQEAAAQLANLRQEKSRLEADRRELQAALRRKAAEEAEAGIRAEALAAELNRHREELAAVNRSRQALGETASALRRRLDLLVQAHHSLRGNLAKKNQRLLQAEAEKDFLSLALTRQKRNLLRLVAARQEMRAELGSARLKLTDLEKEQKALLGQLEEAKLSAEVAADAADSDKKILEDRLGGLEQEKERLAGQLTDLEAGVTDSLLPLIAVLGEALWRGEARFQQTREKHGLTLTRMKQDSELREANLRLTGAARELELAEAVQAEKDQWAEGLAKREEELAQAAAAAQIERESRQEAREKELAAAVRHERERWEKILARRETGLAEEAEAALEAARAEREHWAGVLAEREAELAQARERLHSLSEPPAPRPALSREQESLIARLNRRSQKLGQAMDLMKRRYDRRLSEAGRVESELRRDLEGQALEMKEHWNRLAELEPLLDYFLKAAEESLPPGDANLELARYLREENRGLGLEDGGREPAVRLSAAFKARLDGFHPLVEFLARSFVAGVAELAQARQDRAAWEASQAELEARLSGQTEEIETLKGELVRADRDLAEQDGRLEAAWAGMNFLGARAGDRLGEMKSRLENQARQVDSLTTELSRRDTRIRELEERQDQLSLLYWTLVAQAGALPASLEPPAPVSDDSEPPAPDQMDQAQSGGGFNLGRQLLEGAKKVARRSLFSLILAGSLVLAGPKAEAEAPEADRLPPSPPALAARFDSDYIGRPVGLEQVAPASRLAGREAVEERLAVMVRELSAAQGLTEGEFLRLVRAARGPDAPVHLADFSGRKGALALLEAHFPKLTPHLALWPPEIMGPGPLKALLKNAASLRAGEGGFWERIFFDLWAESDDQEAALTGFLNHMTGRDPSAPRLEFAGRLAPFSPLENLGHERFVDFMSAHLKSAWAGAGGRPRELAARRLAGDLFFNARFFQMPLTLFAVLIQQEAEEGLTVDLYSRGATLALHHRGAHLAHQTRRAAVTWEAGRPLLCDLDEALGEKTSFIESLYRKKLALIQALNRYLSAGDSLLSALPE